MKRSEPLRSLSRDHHRALSVAQRMRTADDRAEVAEAFLEFWKGHGEPHFRVEEEVLLPCWGLLGTVDREAAAQLSSEHLRIRTAAMALDVGRYPLDRIGEFGIELAAHIRFEERELFPMIEEDLGAQRLDRLAAVVAAAEERR
jgi:hypothetical protein